MKINIWKKITRVNSSEKKLHFKGRENTSYEFIFLDKAVKGVIFYYTIVKIVKSEQKYC